MPPPDETEAGADPPETDADAFGADAEPTGADDASARVHLSDFYETVVEVRAAVDVLFDALAFIHAGHDESEYQAFKAALRSQHERVKRQYIDAAQQSIESDDM